MARAYRYYIGWTMSGNGYIRCGGTDINRAKPIRNLDDVQELRKFLRGHYSDDSLSVQSFSRYEDE